jgi:hypothetical protein
MLLNDWIVLSLVTRLVLEIPMDMRTLGIELAVLWLSIVIVYIIWRTLDCVLIAMTFAVVLADYVPIRTVV